MMAKQLFTATSLVLLMGATHSCKSIPRLPSSDAPTPPPANASEAGPAPYAKLDSLRKRYPDLVRWDSPDNDAVSKAFATVRRTAAWRSFVRALRICDDSVNSLLEQDILDWNNASSKVDTINAARNAWRTACTYGIVPPEIPRGATSFEEDGLRFRLYAINRADGILVVRSQRDQVLGIFDLRLHDGGRQHAVAHMLERALRYPDTYLSYPWDIVMATDTIWIPDVNVVVDRVSKTASAR